MKPDDGGPPARAPRLTIPAFSLPPMLAGIASRLPQWQHAMALVAALNAAKRLRVLPADSLALLEGRTFLVEVEDAGAHAWFTYRQGWFRPLFGTPADADLALRARLSAYVQLLARQEDPDTLFFKRELSIEGDTELGLVVKNMLDAVEWPSLPGQRPGR